LRAYNPLEKRNLAESIVTELLRKPTENIPPAQSFDGAGIYVLYYTGDFEAYQPIATRNRDGLYEAPIYVGKAVSKGGRTGGMDFEAAPGPWLYERLVEHAESITLGSGLQLPDFQCRYLVVDDIFIPLGESLLIAKFQPAWNVFVKGFGNHTPGGGRFKQQPSEWDTLHPGRTWVTNLTGKARDSDHSINKLKLKLERTA